MPRPPILPVPEPGPRPTTALPFSLRRMSRSSCSCSCRFSFARNHPRSEMGGAAFVMSGSGRGRGRPLPGVLSRERPQPPLDDFHEIAGSWRSAADEGVTPELTGVHLVQAQPHQQSSWIGASCMASPPACTTMVFAIGPGPLAIMAGPGGGLDHRLGRSFGHFLARGGPRPTVPMLRPVRHGGAESGLRDGRPATWRPNHDGPHSEPARTRTNHNILKTQSYISHYIYPPHSSYYDISYSLHITTHTYPILSYIYSYTKHIYRFPHTTLNLYTYHSQKSHFPPPPPPPPPPSPHTGPASGQRLPGPSTGSWKTAVNRRTRRSDELGASRLAAASRPLCLCHIAICMSFRIW